MWFALEKVNRGVVADIPRFFGVFSWKRHERSQRDPALARRKMLYHILKNNAADDREKRMGRVLRCSHADL